MRSYRSSLKLSNAKSRLSWVYKWRCHDLSLRSPRLDLFAKIHKPYSLRKSNHIFRRFGLRAFRGLKGQFHRTLKINIPSKFGQISKNSTKKMRADRPTNGCHMAGTGAGPYASDGLASARPQCVPWPCPRRLEDQIYFQKTCELKAPMQGRVRRYATPTWRRRSTGPSPYDCHGAFAGWPTLASAFSLSVFFKFTFFLHST